MPPFVEFVEAQPKALHFHRADALLQPPPLNVRPIGHSLADALHLRCQRFISIRELLKCPARNLHHDVIDGGFEAGDGFFGDVVGEFVEGVADGEFGGEFGDGEAGGFGGECGGA